MLASYEAFTHWWFWAALPVAFVVFGWLDRRLSSYNRWYWSKRGKQPPPHRTSYLDAGRFVLYAVLGVFLSVVLVVDGELLWGVVSAVAAFLFGWLARDRARRNII